MSVLRGAALVLKNYVFALHLVVRPGVVHAQIVSWIGQEGVALVPGRVSRLRIMVSV